MQKQLQDSVCFRLNHPEQDTEAGTVYFTIPAALLFLLVLFADIYVLDYAAAQAAKYILLPLIYGVYP